MKAMQQQRFVSKILEEKRIEEIINKNYNKYYFPKFRVDINGNYKIFEQKRLLENF